MAQPPHDQFVEKLLKNQRQLYAYIASLLPSGDDADELYQQTCLILWQKWEQFDHETEFLTLACGVAYNELRNYLRKKARSPHILSPELLEQLSVRQLKQQDQRAERSQAVARCIAKLPPADQQLVEEVYAQGAAAKSIAEQRGVSSGSLYTRIHRIRMRLMECVNRLTARKGPV